MAPDGNQPDTGKSAQNEGDDNNAGKTDRDTFSNGPMFHLMFPRIFPLVKC
jgi:hypothetical protein